MITGEDNDKAALVSSRCALGIFSGLTASLGLIVEVQRGIAVSSTGGFELAKNVRRPVVCVRR